MRKIIRITFFNGIYLIMIVAMREKVNRRKVLSLTAGSVGATGIAGKATASHEEFCTADWEDGNSNEFNEVNVDHRIAGDGTSPNGNTRLCSVVDLLDTHKNDQGNYGFYIGIGGYAQASEDSWGDCDFIESHGFTFEVDDASLYVPTSSDEVCVFPDAASTGSSTDAEDAAFTALMSAMGLVHPALGAASAAAGAISAGIDVIDSRNENEEENFVDYMWTDNNPSPNDFTAAGHYVHLFVLSRNNQDFGVSFQHVASQDFQCYHSVEECYNPTGQSYAELSSDFTVEYNYNDDGSIILDNEDKEEIPEEELREMGMPEEVIDEGPWYDTDNEEVSVEQNK